MLSVRPARGPGRPAIYTSAATPGSSWSSTRAMQPTGTGTTGAYIDLYLRDLGRLVAAGERRPVTLRLYEDSARHHLVLLRECPLDCLTVQQIREWHFQVAQMARDAGWHTVKTGAGAANRALVLLGLVLRRAEEDGAIPRGSSPSRLVKRFRETPLERYLTDDETALLWKAIASVEKMTVRRAPRPYKALAHSPFQAFRLILLLGLRKSEALTLRWSGVDMADSVIRFKSKTGYREVALSEPALEVLREQLRRRVSEWVFPSRIAGKYVRHVYLLWRKIVEVSGIDPTGVVIQAQRDSHTLSIYRRDMTLLGALGHLPVAAVSPPHIIEWHERLCETLTSARAFAAYNSVRVLFGFARRRGLIPSNTAAGLEITHRAKPARPLTPEEVVAWRVALDALQAKRIGGARRLLLARSTSSPPRSRPDPKDT